MSRKIDEFVWKPYSFFYIKVYNIGTQGLEEVVWRQERKVGFNTTVRFWSETAATRVSVCARYATTHTTPHHRVHFNKLGYLDDRPTPTQEARSQLMSKSAFPIIMSSYFDSSFACAKMHYLSPNLKFSCCVVEFTRVSRFRTVFIKKSRYLE